MQKFTIKKGSTSRILMIDIYDSSSTVGARLAGLVFNSASLTAYYNREGAAGAATAITLATATKGTWATGGFVAIDATNMPGHYELHIPDAALVTGSNSVLIELKGATNMVPKTVLIELVDNVEADTYAIVNHATYGNSALNTDIDAVKVKTDYLPSATAGAAGGVMIAGSNAATTFATLTVTGASTFTGNVAYQAGITVTQSTLDGNGISITGNGAGSGMIVNGGATGHGIYAKSGMTGAGSGIKAEGAGINPSYGIFAIGYRAGLYALGITFGIDARTDNGGTACFHAGPIEGATTGNIDGLKAESLNSGVPIRGNVTGNLSGSVGSVTGAVGSVTAGVTVTTNNDKTGYALSTAGVQAIWDALTSALIVVGSIGKRLVDYIDIAVSSRLASTGYTAPDNTGIGNIYNIVNSVTYGNSALDTDLNTLLARIPTEVAQKSHLVNGTGNITPSLNKGLWDALGDGTVRASSTEVAKAADYTTARAAKLDNLDATVSSRAPELGGNVVAIKAKTDTILWTDITDIKDATLGKWSINKTTNVLTMYKADGVTVLKQFNLTDNASVSERVPV